MSTSSQKHQPFQPRVQKRMFLISTGLLLLTLMAVLMIFNALHVIYLPGSWSGALEVMFTALGIIIAYCQWVLPVSPSSFAGIPLDNHTQSAPISDMVLDLETLRQQIGGALDKRLKKGALIVLASDHQVAQEIKVVSQLAWVRSSNAHDQLSEVYKETVKRHRVGTGYICAAIYRYLDANDYVVWSDTNQPTSTPVFENEVVVVDWR